MGRKWQGGFTLLEAVVSIGIFTVSIVGLVLLGTLARATSDQSRDTVQAANYLQEGLEAVRLIRDAAWANVSTTGSYRLVSQAGSTPPWSLSTSGSEVIGTKYTRTVTIAAVRREDSDGDGVVSAGDKIVPSGGAFDDPETRKITVAVTWSIKGRTVTRSLYAYLTKWQE